MSIGPLVAGAIVGAAGADVYDKAKDAVTDVTGGDPNGGTPAHFQMMIKILTEIEQAHRVANKRSAPDVWNHLQLKNNDVTHFNNRGYKHCWLLCTVSFKLDYVMQIGTIQFQTVVGWNNFDIPGDSLIRIDASDIPSTEVVVYFSNDDKHLPGLTS